MAPVNLRLITECIEKFKNHDPAVYERFIRLVDQYVYELMTQVTDAPTEDILVAKGRAQQGRKFLQLFTEFPVKQPPTP